MTDEQPEQWAVELAAKVIPAWWHDNGGARGYESPIAAKLIQRAFTERTADLVADNAKLREAIKLAMHVLEDAPDLNPDNYTHDEAMTVNDTSNRAWICLEEALAQQDKPDAD